QVDNIQAQVNQLVVEGDSSVEAAQARVDAEGKSYPTLKARLDAKETEFSSQLASIEERKADKEEVNQLSSQLAQTAQEVERKRDKNQLIDLNEMTERTLAAIEGGEGTTFNLESIPRNYSVSSI